MVIAYYVLLAAAAIMVYSCHSTIIVPSFSNFYWFIRSLFVGLDVVDKPIGGGVMSCGWSSSPQLRLNYLGQLLAKLNPTKVVVYVYTKTALMTCKVIL